MFGTWPNVDAFKEHIRFNIHHDKKRKNDKIVMALITDISKPVVNEDVPVELIMDSIDYYISLG